MLISYAPSHIQSIAGRGNLSFIGVSMYSSGFIEGPDMYLGLGALEVNKCCWKCIVGVGGTGGQQVLLEVYSWGLDARRSTNIIGNV